MKIISFLKFSVLFYICVIECKLQLFQLKDLVNVRDFYQITSFVSSNISEVFDWETTIVHEFPSVTYSFNFNNLNNSHETFLKNMFALQESLIIFYTSNLKEINSFIEFLLPKLTIRKRPKCLIEYISNKSTEKDEIDVNGVLKYAWNKKFLDFTILVTPLNIVYHYNPFNDAVQKKEIQDKNIKIFPDKLRNGLGHSIFTPKLPVNPKIINLRKSKRGLKIYVDSFFEVDFAASVLNFSMALKEINASYELIYDEVFFRNWSLDFFPLPIVRASYLSQFIIPVDDESSNNIVAFVPILPISQTNIFVDKFYDFTITFGLISVCLYVYNHFQKKVKYLKTFDIVMLLFGQSLKYKAYETINMVIMTTTIAVSIILMNDILSHILSIMFVEKGEIPFETYEDLYNSKLQPYTDIFNLKNAKGITDKYLLKILNNISYSNKVDDCFDTLKRWKNVTCLIVPQDPQYYISSYRNPDGSQAIKVAQPPIFVLPSGFHWFSENSPYAMKFFEIMQRTKETGLMHWKALVAKNREIYVLEETKVTTSERIELEQLLVILSLGLSIANVVFTIELLLNKSMKKLFKRILVLIYFYFRCLVTLVSTKISL